MAIDPKRLLAIDIPDVEQRYTEQDIMLYAIGIGYGHDPLDGRALRYCYEKDLLAAATIPVALGHPGFWMRDLDTGIDWRRVVHGEEGLELIGEIPLSGTVRSKTWVTDVIDKGADKGALVVFERHLTEASTGQLIAKIRQSNYCRGDGGFDPVGSTPTAGPPGSKAPIEKAGNADLEVELPTRPETALLVRLCADRNPLHVDPDAAKAAGFDRPILHGLVTYGVAAHAIVKSCCDYDARRLKSIGCRFSGILYPGETVRTRIWLDGDSLGFDAWCVERNTKILSEGRATLRA